MPQNSLTAMLITLLTPIIPTLFLILGSQFLLNQYEARKKNKELQIELLGALREKQYAAVETLYRLFSLFMALYREINSPTTDLSDDETRKGFLKRAIEAEAEVDALILRIGCEFAHASTTELENLLGHLRQSVQLWRQTLRQGQKLPFSSSDHPGYVRFKETFARTAVFMVEHIHQQLEPSKLQQKQAVSLLIDVFSNTYEFARYESIQSQGSRKA